jgi:hypothetical protein
VFADLAGGADPAATSIASAVTVAAAASAKAAIAGLDSEAPRLVRDRRIHRRR